jgi:hypothetical protein
MVQFFLHAGKLEPRASLYQKRSELIGSPLKAPTAPTEPNERQQSANSVPTAPTERQQRQQLKEVPFDI